MNQPKNSVRSKATVEPSVSNTNGSNNVFSESLQIENDKSTKSCQGQVKRKLHKAFIKTWSKDIVSNGYARCMIATCNFISSNISTMQNHHRICTGLPVHDKNLCISCESYLVDNEELVHHQALCRGLNNSKQNCLITSQSNVRPSDKESDMCSKWERELKTLGQASCGNEECNFVGMKLSDLEEHYKTCKGVLDLNLFCCIVCRKRFATRKEQKKHEQGCLPSEKSSEGVGEKEKNLHIKVIRKMKDSNEDHIIQPGPDLPRGQYTRRRPYTKQHKNSWTIALDKCRYVKCIFQNCYFIAMSLEDMIFHFGYCNGDGSFAKFVCPHCKGRVTSEDILNKHIQRSHSEFAAVAESKTDGEWNEDVEMEVSKEEKSTENNVSSKVPDTNKGNQQRSWRVWQNEVNESGHGSCRKSSCNFISDNVSDLEIHAKTCDGQPDFELFCCGTCRKRLPTRDALLAHQQTCGKDEGRKEECADSGMDEPEVGQTCQPEQSKRPRIYLKQQKKNLEKPTEEIKTVEENSESSPPPQPKKRGRKPKIKTEGSEDPALFNLEPKNLEEKPTEEEKTVEENSESPQPKKRGRKPKMKTEGVEDSVISKPESKNSEEKTKEEEKTAEKNSESPQPKKRGRKPKIQTEGVEDSVISKPELNLDEEVQCGKCGDFKGSRRNFNDHNLRKHVGLGWVEGEEPVDMTNEKELIRLVKMAFKLTKKGTCETCQDVKKSFMGFVTHVQNCGKSDEEKYALKVQCPHCTGRYLKYSLPVHIKLSHYTTQPEGEGPEATEEALDPSKKRQSALRAVTKFQEVLKESEEVEVKEPSYVLFEKGDRRLPKLCSKIISIWYKLKREKKKIPCRHKNCETVSEDVKEAKEHHFACARLPEKVFMCESCEFYSDDEPRMQSHVAIHRRTVKQRKLSAEEMKSELEEDDDEEDDVDDEEEDEEDMGDEGEDSKPSKKRKRKQDDKTPKKKRLVLKPETDDDCHLKQNFCRKWNIENVRGIHFYSCGLNMTMEEEAADVGSAESWPELHTERTDWCRVAPEVAERLCPSLTESISVSFSNDAKWRRFKRFEGDIVEDVPIMFTGGSVRSMSWCKVYHKRMVEKNVRQYLALSTAKGFDVLRNIHDRPQTFQSSLIQIWDCGALDNAPAEETPKLALGIVQEGGEVWDLSWFPENTATEGSDERLPRMALLATASDDGAVRIWSVCDPSQLVHNNGLPIYKTGPVVKLIPDEDLADSCFRLSVGRGGIVAGGYGNGVLAVWHLNNITSPFCKKQGKCRIIRAHLTIQAHRTTITALTLRPNDPRYVTTGGFDRVVKLWDLECPAVPVEQYTKEVCVDLIWSKNWPLIVHNFDDIFPTSNKGLAKFVRNMFSDKNQSCLIMDNMCLSISFSDWLNAMCGSNNSGEVTVRLLKNFITDQKIYEKTQTTISSVHLQKLDGTEMKEISSNEKQTKEPKCWIHVSKTYEEVSSTFGIVVEDNMEKDKLKPKRDAVHPEEFPLRAVNKVCFNPNVKSFTHIAVGYNCGLVRIQCLTELQANRNIKAFLEKIQKQTP